MKFFLLSFFFFVTLLVACNQEEAKELNLLDPIEVDLNFTTPLELDTNIVTQIIVTQVREPVENVSETVVEIWQHGKPNTYQLLNGEKVSSGVYEVTWKAYEAGIYYFYYHVTAQGMHRMEKHTFTIGDVNEEEILAIPDERPKKHMH